MRHAATTHDPTFPQPATSSSNTSSATSTIDSSAAAGTPARTGRSRRRDETTRLLALMAETPTGAERTALQDELITVNMSVATDVAKRYHDRGIASADIDQVALLGLTKAARGYDPAKGSDFLSFAVPTIRGEIRRHFRDAGWAVRPPRRIQELQPRITAAEATLFQKLGRSPRPSELAEHLEVDLEEVLEALSANGCFAPTSLDAPAVGGEVRPVDLLGEDDDGFVGAEARAALRPLLRGLSDRERLILELRFCQGMTQREIGEVVGVTQMQISRVLSQVLARLRERLLSDSAA